MAAASAADILATTLISLFRPLFTPVDEALSRLLVPSRSAYPSLKSSLLLKPASPAASPVASPQQQKGSPSPKQQQQQGSSPRRPSRNASLSLPPMAVIIAAVLLNHIRRVLVPWLGQFVWRHPIEAMKLARSSPCYLLEQSAGEGFAWGAVLAWGLRVRLLSAVREVLLRKMRDGPRSVKDSGNEKRRDAVSGVGDANGRAGEGSGLDKKDVGPRDGEADGRALGMSSADDMLLDACRIVYLATSIALLEGAYAESCWAAAHIYALLRTTTTLLSGTLDPSARSYVFNALSSHWSAAVFQACLIANWIAVTLLPTAAWVVRGALARADVYTPAGAYALWAGTALLVRKSNKYFIVLEMSEMLVTFGWAALGMGVLTVWAVEEFAARREAAARGRVGRVGRRSRS